MTSAFAFRRASDQTARGVDQMADHVAIDLENNFIGVRSGWVDPHSAGTTNGTRNHATKGVVLDH